MSPLPVTLVVITHNEAAHIARCLDSVDFVAEKLVLDSGSDDATVEIATAHGARVERQAWLGFGAQRNAAARLARHDWLLCLDADEALTPALAAELRARLPAIMACGAVGVLNRTAWFMGRPMRWYRLLAREPKARLYHRAQARWSEARVHESLQYDGPAVRLREPFFHYLNPTLVHHELKYLRYAELKALDWRDRGRSLRPWEWPAVFLGTFLKEYIVRLALLDGWRGFAAAHLAAHYALYKRLRYYEMSTNPASVTQAAKQLQKHGLER